MLSLPHSSSTLVYNAKPWEGEEKNEDIAICEASVSWPTALSGSQIKPPALPGVHDLIVLSWIRKFVFDMVR